MMAKYLILWRPNPNAPWPADPAKYLQLDERMWSGIEGLMKRGEVKEIGYFPNGIGGYIIGEGDATTLYRDVLMFQPHYLVEVHEIISFEKHKEISRAVWKAKIEAAKM
jgi:hypothetical protein